MCSQGKRPKDGKKAQRVSMQIDAIYATVPFTKLTENANSLARAKPSQVETIPSSTSWGKYAQARRQPALAFQTVHVGKNKGGE